MCGLGFGEGEREDGGTLPKLHSSFLLHLKRVKTLPSLCHIMCSLIILSYVVLGLKTGRDKCEHSVGCMGTPC